ncbi:MAG: hypothetical protein ACK5PZ_07575, partial [Pirellula sp.]
NSHPSAPYGAKPSESGGTTCKENRIYAEDEDDLNGVRFLGSVDLHALQWSVGGGFNDSMGEHRPLFASWIER